MFKDQLFEEDHYQLTKTFAKVIQDNRLHITSATHIMLRILVQSNSVIEAEKRISADKNLCLLLCKSRRESS
jgi:hypothetical protein